MTVRTFTGELAVVTRDGESRLTGVIEVLPIERPQISIPPLVFDMADGTITHGDLSMEALLCGHPSGDLIVTDQAPVAIDVEVVVMAVVAAVGIFEAFVSEAQPPGHEIDLFFLRECGQGAANHGDRQKRSSET